MVMMMMEKNNEKTNVFPRLVTCFSKAEAKGHQIDVAYGIRTKKADLETNNGKG